MRLVLICVFCLLLGPVTALSQCVTSDFEIPSQACLDQQIKLESDAVNATEHEWFLCDTDYSSSPSTRKLVSGYGPVYYSKIIESNGSTYLFFVSQSLNKLVGLRFEDLTSLAYEVHCEIDISGMITNPAGFDLIHEDGRWFGLVSNVVSPFKLVKFVLAEDLKTIAEWNDLSTVAALSTPFQIEFATQQDVHYAFIANSTAPPSRQLIRLTFGTSLNNVPTATYIALPVSGQSASMAIQETCDDFAVFLSLRNGKLLRISFGADAANPAPAVNDLALSAPISDPGGLALVRDHDQLVLIIQSRNGNVYSGMVESLNDDMVEIKDLGNIKTTIRDWGIEPLRVNGQYRFITANFTTGGNGGFYVLEFDADCSSALPFALGSSATTAFLQPGTSKVTLITRDEEGRVHSTTREVLVSQSVAPNLSIVNPPAYCVDAAVPFTFTADVAVTTQWWEFGDGAGTSLEVSPGYDFPSAGVFEVSLTASAANGCENTTTSTITIYEKPEADFTIPAGLLCTNNEFTFINTTAGDYGGHLEYEWLIDGNAVSTEPDLAYTFTSTGAKGITLNTSIPGCADQVSKTTSSIQEGPVVDFSVAGACEGETFDFREEIPEAVSAYHWNFGNGFTATDPNPTQTFHTYGDYLVSLTATNAIGCQNTAFKEISVHSNPVAGFSAEGPPNTCTNTPVLFLNETVNPDTRQVTEWLWEYGDPSDPGVDNSAEGQHVFSVADTYGVRLTAVTEAGCSGTFAQEVTIQPSPSGALTSGPACVDVPVSFEGPSGESIADWYWQIGTAFYLVRSPTHTFASAGDHELLLRVTDSNGCVTRVDTTLVVPVPLMPEFSATGNCAGEEAVFTDITEGTDAVATRRWSVDGSPAGTSSPWSYTFADAGSAYVTLEVTTISGCTYVEDRVIGIASPPVAGFTATPAAGAYPLEVEFVNTSSLATEYFWSFNDGAGSMSTEVSPVHTFFDEGSFEVMLTAYNGQGCEDVFSSRVETLAPYPDADIERILLVPNPDGSTKLVITINNTGNTILKEAFIDVDFAGALALRQELGEPVTPGTQYNVVFNTGILNASTLNYVCASLTVDGDRSPEGNRRCEDLQGKLFLLPPHPNPASTEVNVSWITAAAGMVRISLIDAMGRQVFADRVESTTGLNLAILQTNGLGTGVYFLIVDDGVSVVTQRIAVSGNP